MLVTDGLNSFAIFLYDDNGINWIDTDRKYSSSSEYTFAQVGVDSGNEKYFTLPGSGTANVAVLAKYAIPKLYILDRLVSCLRYFSGV